MELDTALREGPSFLKNAEDSLNRNITNPDLLYMWDNQVAVIDTYLADTEVLNGQSEELTELRSKLRDVKKQLERKVMEFEAQQEGEEVPEDPPADEMAEDFKGFATELIQIADDALSQKVEKVDDLPTLEDPRSLVNGFLADSEPYKADDELRSLREDVRARKEKLDAQIKAIEEEWRQQDLAAGT